MVALGNGTLPERKFRYYILQDGRFLGDLARVFAISAKKAPDADSAIRFAKLVEETLVVERSLHENYGKRWSLSRKYMAEVPMAPRTMPIRAICSRVAETNSALAATVVALPCAWIYCVVGQHLLRKGAPPKSHPYRDWLMLYGSPEFAAVGRWMRREWTAGPRPPAMRNAGAWRSSLLARAMSGCSGRWRGRKRRGRYKEGGSCRRHPPTAPLGAASTRSGPAAEVDEGGPLGATPSPQPDGREGKSGAFSAFAIQTTAATCSDYRLRENGR